MAKARRCQLIIKLNKLSVLHVSLLSCSFMWQDFFTSCGQSLPILNFFFAFALSTSGTFLRLLTIMLLEREMP
jgi:hypothetical protein